MSTTYSYKVAILSGKFNIWPLPSYTISPDPSGCPEIQFQFILQSPAGVNISKVFTTLTPTASEGMTIWCWDQALGGVTLNVYLKAWVPGYESVFDMSQTQRIYLQAGNNQDKAQMTTTLTCNGSWPNQTYQVGTPAILLPVPTCTGSTGSILWLIFTFASPANNFMQSITTTTPEQLSIYTTNPLVASTSAYTVQVITTEFYSNLKVTKTFQLTITCAVISVDMTTSAIASFVYYIGSPTVNTPFPTFVVYPNCGNRPLIYTLKMQAGGTVPSAFSINSSTLQFIVTQGVSIATGTYNLQIVATETFSTSGRKFNGDCLFTVTIKCTSSIAVQTNPIPASTTYILNPNTLTTVTLGLPTYVNSPSTCAFGPLYSVKNVATGACEPWITCAPTSNIVIGTTDWTKAGTYNFRIDLTDSQSDVTNSSVTFTIIIKIMNATSITVSSAPPNQQYTVSQAALVIDLPTYTWYPTQSETVFTYQITVGPSFVTISGSPKKINIFTTVASDTGTHTITIKTTETNSGLTATVSFTLLVSCVQTIAPASALANIVYYVTDPAITRTPAYSLTPSSCPNELVLTVTLSDGSSLPASITYSTPNISVYSTNYAATNVYALKIVATDPKTGIQNQALTLNVTILCTKSISLLSGAIQNFTYQIVLASPFEKVVPLPQYQVSPSQCASGAFTYELVSLDAIPYPTFFTQYPTTSINVITQDVTKVRAYNFKLKVTESISGLFNEANVFICNVIQPNYATSIAWVTASKILDFTYLIGSPEVQLHAPSFTYVPSNADVKFTLTLGASTPAFITLVTQGTGLPNISVVTSNTAHTGIYTISYILTEVFSGLTQTANFVLTVSCVQSIAVGSSIAPVLYYISDPAINSSIPLYQLTPSSCPYELQYSATLADGSPLPNAISLINLSGNQNIHVTETDPYQTGMYTVRIKVIDPKTGVLNLLQTLDVTIKCTKSLNIVTNTIPAMTQYTINTSQLLTTSLFVPDYEPYPANCEVGFVDFEISLNPSSAAFPDWIFQYPFFTIDIGTQDTAVQGVYNFRLTATDNLTGLKNSDVVFSVEMIAISALTLDAATAIPNQVYKVADPAIVLAVPRYVQTPSTADTSYSYSLVSPTPAFVTLLGTGDQTSQLQIVTSDYSQTGSYTVTIQTNEEYSQLTKTFSFSLLVTCVRSILTNSTIGSQIYYIGDPQISIAVPTYKLTPGVCPVDLIHIVKLADGTALPNAIKLQTVTGSEAITIYETNTSLANVYSVKVVAVDQKTLIQSDSLTFSVTIRLRATGLNIIAGTEIADLTYRVSSPAVLLNVPEYTIQPANANTKCFHALGVTTPAFVTLVGDPYGSPKIQIVTSNVSSTGIYNIDVVYTDNYSGLTKTDTFVLTVSCVSSIAPFSTLADVLYYITDPAIHSYPKYVLTPAGCPNELVFSVKLQDGSPLPSSIQFDSTPATETISVYETNYALTAQYVVTITVTDPKSGLQNSAQTLHITVKCTKSIDLISGLVTDKTYQIDLDQPWALNVPFPVFQQNPVQCAVGTISKQLVYTGTQTAPTFITQNPIDNIHVATQVIGNTGVYPYKIVATDSITGLVNNQDVFTITIAPPTLAISVSIVPGTEISDLTYLVGSSEVLLDVAQYTLDPPNADRFFSYTVSAQPTAAFVSVVEQTAGVFKVKILTASSADTGIYTVDVRFKENYSGLTHTNTFVLAVSCVQSIAVGSPMTPLLYYISDPAINSSIPLYQLTPSTCPYELQYSATLADGSPLPNAISLINLSGSQTIHVTETDPYQTGVYTVRIKVVDPKTGVLNLLQSLDVTIKCTKSINIVTNTIPATTQYTINTSQLLTTSLFVPDYEPYPANCEVGFVDFEISLNPSSAAFPDWIFQYPFFTIDIGTQDPAAQGVYNFKLTATDNLTGLKNSDVVFSVEMIAISALTLDAATAIPNQIYKVADQAIVLSVPRYVQTPSTADTSYSYSLVSPTPAFVTLIGTGDQTSQLQIVTSDYTQTGSYTVTIQTNEEYSQLAKTFSFSLLVTCVRSLLTASTIGNQLYYIGDPQISIPVPTYALTPSGCPVELTYLVQLADGSALPNAIKLDAVIFGSEAITIYETNTSLANVYSVQVVAVDQKTLIQSDSLTFSVTIRLRATGLNIIAGTEVADLTYRVSQPAVLLNVPEYTIQPANANTKCFHALGVSTPAFVTLVGDPYGSPKIQIVNSNIADTGIYSIDVIYTDTYSGLTKTDTFLLTVSCVSSIAPLSTLVDVLYYITDPAINSYPKYVLTPAGCPNELVFSVKLQDGSPLPSSIQFDSTPATETISVYETNYALTAQYVVTITVTDPKSGLQNSAQTLHVTVKCTKSIDLISGVVTDKTYQIDLDQPWALNVPFPDFQQSPVQCAVGTISRQLVYTGTQTAPTFITQDPIDNIHIATQVIGNTRVYPYKIVATDSLTGLVNNQDVFTITIAPPNLASSITIVSGTEISDLNYLIGSPELLLDVAQYTLDPPNADRLFSYTVSASPTAAFVSVVEPTPGVFKVKILTADSADTGIYTVDVKFLENYSGLTHTNTFVLTVSCVQSIAVGSPMAPALYYISDPAINQSIPLYELTPSSCPYELQYSATLADGSPLPNAISLINLSGSQTIHVTETNPQQTGVYTVRIKVVDPKTGVLNLLQSLEVTIKCTKSINIVTNMIPATTQYTINTSQLLTTILFVPDYEPYPANCEVGFLDFEISLNPSSAAFPDWIFQYPFFTIDIGTQDPAAQGIYNFKLTATDNLTGLKNSDVVFSVEMIAISALTLDATTAIPNQVYKVADPAIVLPVPRYVQTPSTADTSYSYSLVSPTPAFVTLLGTGDQTSQLQIVTSDYTQTGSYTVTIQTNEEYSQLTKTFSFSLLVTCVRSMLTSSTIGSQLYYIGDPQISIPVPTYALTPSGCPLELSYSVKLADGSTLPNAIQLDAAIQGSELIRIFEDNTTSANIYEVHVIATDKKTLIQSDTLTFQVTVRLRADGLNIIAGTEVADLTYRVSSPVVLLSVPEYTIQPANANIKCFHALGASAPAFVTLVGDSFGSPQIRIETLNIADTGIYSIDVIYTDTYSGLTKTDTFVLTVSCVSSIAPLSTLVDVLYYITDPAIHSYPKYVLTPAGCPNELVFSVKLQDGSPLPSSIQFDSTPATETISVYETNYALTAQYVVTITVTDPKSGLQNSAQTQHVTVKCTKSIDLISGVVTDKTYQIDLDQPWSLNVPLPVFQQNPVQCAVGTISRQLVYTGTQTAPTFITQDSIDNIHVATQVIGNTGVYPYKIVATDSLTGLVNNQDVFAITIAPPNLVSSITIVSGTEISDLNYMVGSPELLLDVAQYTLDPPNADRFFSYTVSASPTAAFVFVVEPTPGVFKVKILTADSADTGIYTVDVKFKENYSGLTHTNTFVLTVSCVQSIAVGSPMASVLYYINDPAINSSIPLYELTPSSCPYELQYSATLADGSPLPNAISLINLSGSQTIHVTETDPQQTGVYTVRIKVVDPKTGVLNLLQSLDVTIKCTKSINIVTNTIPATTQYTINTSQLLTTSLFVPDYVPYPANCEVGFVDFEISLNPSSAAFPDWIFQYPFFTIDIGTQDPAAQGVYNFRLTATDNLTGLKNSDVVFSVEMIAISALTLDAATAIPNQVYKVADPAIVLAVPRYVQTPSNADTSYSYSLVSPTPAFVTLLGTGDQTSQLQIVTSDYTLTGSYTVTIQTNEEYSQLINTFSFSLLVTCVRSMLTSSTIGSQLYYIGDPQISIPVPTYALTPSGCPLELTYSVKLADGSTLPNAIQLDATTKGSEVINIQETNTSAANVYEVHVIAIDNKTLIQSDVLAFKVTIRLRVIGLNLVSGTQISDLTYLVSSPAVFLNVPEYTMNPPNANIDNWNALGSNTPSFVTLIGDPSTSPQIQILTTSPADTGVYTIDVIYTDKYSGLQMNDQFVLIVSCVRQIKQPGSIAPIVYFITDTKIPVQLLAYQITPAECPYELVISAVTLQNGDSLPAAISFDGINTVNIFENTYSATGSYFVKVTATDPKSKVMNSDLVFKVIVKCTKRIDLIMANLPTTTHFEIDEKHLNTLTLTQPTFTPYPSQCAIGTFSYQLADSTGNVITMPGFLTQFSNTALTIATTDKTFKNVYDWSIKVTEPVSGLANNDVHFQLTLTVKIYALQMNLVTDTIIPDQNYLLGSSDLILLAYQYSFVPVNAVLDVVYTLVNPPAFVSLVNSSGTWVKISTNDPTDTGVYTIEVKTVDNESGLWQTQYFKLVVSCVRQISSNGPLLDVTYWISDPAISRQPTYVLTPAGCSNELVYQVTLQNGSPLPQSIQFSAPTPQNPTIAVYETDYLLTAQYQVKVLVTDPKTGQQNSEYSFHVTILCTKTIEIASDRVNDFSYQIDLDQPWTKYVSVPKYIPNPPQCAVGTYSLQVITTAVGALPQFINEFPTSQLIVATQDANNAGTYNLKIKAIESISGLINDIDAFVLTVLKPIYTEQLIIVPGTQINDFLYSIGSPKVVLAAPRFDVYPANADKKLVYSLDPSTPAFVTLVPNASGVPTLEIVSGSNADLGVYTISVIVTEFFSGVTTTQSFKLTVSCVQSIAQYNAMAPVVYYIRDPAIGVAIPLYSLTPSTCPYQLIYSATLQDSSPLPNAISLLNQSGSWVLKLYETDPALTGIYIIRIAVVDPLSGFKDDSLTVKVIVKCAKSITLVTDTIPDINRTNQIDPATTYTNDMPTYDVIPNFCLKQTFLLTVQYVGVPIGTALPSWLTYDQSTVVIKTSDSLGVKVYNFQVKAIEPLSGLTNSAVAFKVVSANGPAATQITVEDQTLIADQTYLIGDPTITIAVPSYTAFPSYVDVEYLYDFVTPYPFISISYDLVTVTTVQISSTDPLDYGLYNIELRATETFSGLTSVTKFQVQVTCVRSILPTAQVIDLTYWISDPKKVTHLPLIQLNPILCPNVLAYTIGMQDGSALPSSIQLDPTKGAQTVTVYETQWPQTGVFPVQVTLTDPSTKVTAFIPFTITIKCTKKITVANNPLMPLQYNVGTDLLEVIELQLPSYAPFPPGCAYGIFTFELFYLNNAAVAFPGFISQFPAAKIVVATQETTYLGSNQFRIVSTDPLTGLKNDEVITKVDLFCQTLELVCQKSGFDGNIKYTPGLEGIKQISLPAYDFVPARCTESYTTEIVPIARNLQTSTTLPNWIWLSDDQKSFYIWSMDTSLSGTFGFKIRTKIPKYNVMNEELKFTISFDCVITEIFASLQPSDLTYYIDPNRSTVTSIPMPKFTAFPNYCQSDFIISVATNSTNVSADQFATIDSTANKLRLSSTDLNILGSYDMKIQALEPRRGTSRSVNFSVQLDCKVTKVSQSNSFIAETALKYTIGASPVEFLIPKFETLPQGCNKPLKFALFLQAINGVQLTNTQALPSFITLDAARGVIRLYGTNDYEAKKTYTFFLTALEPLSKIGDKFPYTFTVEVAGQTQPPKFVTTLSNIDLSESILNSSTSLVYKLPPITGGKVSNVLVHVGGASPFLSFNLVQMQFEVNTKVALNTPPGVFPVTVTLQDEFGASTKNTFMVNLFPERIVSSQTTTAQLPADIIRNQQPSQNIVKDDFVSASPFGNKTDNDKLGWAVDAQSQSYMLKTTGLSGKISKVQMDGSFQVDWSDEIFSVYKESLVSKNAVQVRVIWMNEAILSEQDPKPAYRVRIEDVNERFISFRLLFDDPELISRGTLLDIVEVHFSNPAFFIRVSDLAILEPNSRILIQEIPRQLSASQAAAWPVKKVQQTAKSATGVAVTSIATSTISGVSAATVWGLFNTIQLISMQAYTGSEMPSNAANIFKTLDDFMRGGPLNPGKLFNKMLADKSEQSVPVLSRRLQNLALQTEAQTTQTLVSTKFIPKNPLVETGFFVLVIAICILMSISLTIYQSFSSTLGPCGSWFNTYLIGPLKRLFMFNLMIQAQQFGYLYFVLSGIKQKVFVQHLLAAGSTKQFVNFTLYYLVFAYVTIYPISVCFFLILAGAQGLQNSTIKAHFGALYSGLEVSKIINAQFTTLFLLRRLIVGVTIAFLRTYYFVQLEILMVSSMVCLCFILLCRPYKTALNNAVEMLNESFVIFTVYLMHGFSFFIPSQSLRYQIGWAYIGVVGVVFILNSAVIIQKLVLFAIKKARQIKARRSNLFKKNALGNLFTWKQNTIEKKRKRKMAFNVVAPMNSTTSADNVKRIEKRASLPVIDEEDVEEDSVWIPNELKKDSWAKGVDNLVEHSVTEQSESTHKESQASFERKTCLLSPDPNHQPELQQQTPEPLEISSNGQTQSYMLNKFSNKSQSFSHNQPQNKLLVHNAQASNLLAELENFVSAEDSTGRNCGNSSKNNQLFDRRTKSILYPQQSKWQSQRLLLVQEPQKVDWRFAEDFTGRSRLTSRMTASNPESENLQLKFSDLAENVIDQHIKDLEREIMTPEHQRDLLSIGSESQDAKVIYQKRPSPRVYKGVSSPIVLENQEKFGSIQIDREDTQNQLVSVPPQFKKTNFSPRAFNLELHRVNESLPVDLPEEKLQRGKTVVLKAPKRTQIGKLLKQVSVLSSGLENIQRIKNSYSPESPDRLDPTISDQLKREINLFGIGAAQGGTPPKQNTTKIYNNRSIEHRPSDQ